MKPATLTILLVSYAITCSNTVQADIVHNFQFADAAGTGLQNTANTGSLGTSWNFNVNGSPGEAATDGSGIFHVGADAIAGSGAITSDYTRKLTFTSTPFTNGAFAFEYRLDSWDLDETGALNTSDDQEGITLKLRGISGDVNLITALNGGSSNVRVRHATSGLTATAGQANIGFTGSDLVVRVEGDLTTGEFTTSYNLGGAGFNTLISDGAGLTDINEIILTIAGAPDGWASTDAIGIDYIQLSAVPEPSSALMLGLGLVGLATVRRRAKR